MFSVDSKDLPKSPETNSTDDKEDKVPHDGSASEKSLSDKSVDGKSASEQSSSTDTPRHKIVLDRNVCIKLGKSH